MILLELLDTLGAISNLFWACYRDFVEILGNIGVGLFYSGTLTRILGAIPREFGVISINVRALARTFELF